METLKDKYKEYFKIGTAVNSFNIKENHSLIVEHFNSVTCENSMKYGVVLKKNGEYDLKYADEHYMFAKNNSIAVRGHNFVWHNQTAKQIMDHSREEVIDILRKHMILMNEKYGEITYAWDVVNEAIEDKSDEYLRKSVWKDKLGEDYIKDVFRLARECVNPGTELFYNDYNEYVPEKMTKIERLIKSVNADEKLIDGMGMQCHVNLYYPGLDLMRKAIELYISLGLRIHITEMDLSYYRFEDRSSMDKPTKELEEKHAKLYGDYFALFREYKDYIDSVTLWGAADSYTWLDYFPVHNRKNWPLLFDVDGKPKEAFYRVMDF
ncbi:MAG: endo-1,4-beta-xylanase [Lachnospiraceae bacterium]|nr:endo-1,4-beta-xylanase [Lachnospiraceae bacterium]